MFFYVCILTATADDVQVQQLKEENLQLKEKLQRVEALNLIILREEKKNNKNNLLFIFFQVDMGMDMTGTHFPKRPHTF